MKPRLQWSLETKTAISGSTFQLAATPTHSLPPTMASPIWSWSAATSSTETTPLTVHSQQSSSVLTAQESLSKMQQAPSNLNSAWTRRQPHQWSERGKLALPRLLPSALIRRSPRLSARPQLFSAVTTPPPSPTVWVSAPTPSTPASFQGGKTATSWSASWETSRGYLAKSNCSTPMSST